jgi:hypothetical protein
MAAVVGRGEDPALTVVVPLPAFRLVLVASVNGSVDQLTIDVIYLFIRLATNF